MYLVNWFTANAMLLGMVVVLVGLPIILSIYAFGGKAEGKEKEME